MFDFAFKTDILSYNEVKFNRIVVPAIAIRHKKNTMSMINFVDERLSFRSLG